MLAIYQNKFCIFVGNNKQDYENIKRKAYKSFKKRKRK